MGLFRRLAGFLGLNKDDADESKDDDLDDGASAPTTAPQHFGPRRGFSVPVQVAVDRPTLGPILVPCVSGDGGVQGFRWFAKRQRIDEDGDVADEFVDEILLEKSSRVEEHHRPLPRFEVKYSTEPMSVRNIRSVDGKIQLEFKDRLEWL